MIENKEKEGSIRKRNFNWVRIEKICKDKSIKIQSEGKK